MEVALGRHGHRSYLNDIAARITGQIFSHWLQSNVWLMFRYEGVEGRSLDRAVWQDGCVSPNDDAVVELVHFAAMSVGLKARIKVRQRHINLEAYVGIARNVIQFLAHRRQMELDVLPVVDEIHGCNVRVAVRTDCGHSSDIG